MGIFHFWNINCWREKANINALWTWIYLITLHLSCSPQCTRGKRAFLFQNRENQVTIYNSCQDTASLAVSTNAAPRKETMKGNNNNLEIWQFPARWLKIRRSAVFALIKTHTFLPCRVWGERGFDRSVQQIPALSVPDNGSDPFYTQIQLSTWMCAPCTVLVTPPATHVHTWEKAHLLAKSIEDWM